MLLALLGLLAQLSSAEPSSGIITLNQPWRFRAGDTAAFARPELSDTGWAPIAVPGAWSPAQRREGGGWGWYRVHYDVPAPLHEPLALAFLSVATAYEVYVDGRRVGGIGGFPPRPRPRMGVPLVLRLPVWAMAPGAHVIAVRVYSAEPRGGITGRVEFATHSQLAALIRQRDYALLATALLIVGIGFYQIVFWFRRPHAVEHLYIFLSCLGLGGFFVCWMPSARLALEPWVHWYRLFLACAFAALASFGFAFRRVLELEDDRWLRGLSIGLLALAPLALLLPGIDQVRLLGRFVGYPGALVWAVTVLVLAWLQARRGIPHAGPLLWGTAVLGACLAHDVAADWGLQLIRSNFSWLILVGTVAFFASLAMATAQKFVDTETAALYDRLTGLYRREVVMNALAREIRRASRTQQPLAVIMLDVDKFKQVNDTLGHQVGDRVLAEIGRRLGEAGRAVDWLGRYGGEEFVAVLASTTKQGAVQAAERLRSAVSALPIATGRTARTMTLSAGVAAYEGQEEWPTTEQLVGAADAALYRAKNGGRDRVSE